MAECNKDVLLESHEQAVANWAYDSNITKFNERSKNELSAEIAKKSKVRAYLHVTRNCNFSLIHGVLFIRSFILIYRRYKNRMKKV